MKPRVSVIIPAFNVDDTIGRVIDSALKQDYDQDAVEVIVVDNNSTDRTAEIIATRPVRRVFEPVRNRSRARNTGAKEATGDYLAFLDADCEAPPHWISSLVASLSHDWIAAAQARVQRTGEGVPTQNFTQGHYGIPYLDSCTLVVRRAAFDAAAGFNEHLNRAVDMDFSFRLLDSGFAFAWVPEVIVLKHHDLTPRQAARRGWVGGINLVRLDHEWRNRVDRSRARLFFDRVKLAARLPIRHVLRRTPGFTVTLTEQFVKVIAYGYASATHRPRERSVRRCVGPVPELLGPNKYLVVADGHALLLDSTDQSITRLTSVQTALLSLALSFRDHPETSLEKARSTVSEEFFRPELRELESRLALPEGTLFRTLRADGAAAAVSEPLPRANDHTQ